MKSKTFSIAVFDIDGTLTDGDGQPDTEALSAIRDLSERGIRIVIATARGPSSLTTFTDAIGIVEVIAFQGALVGSFEAGEWVTETELTIPIESARAIARQAEALELPTSWHHAMSWWVTKRTAEISREERIVGESPTEVGDSESISWAPHKLMFISPEGEEDLLESLASRLPKGLAHTRSHPNYLEVTHRGANKGVALEAMLRRLPADASQVVAFGDGDNDLPLFEVAAVSVAMPHAPSQVREMATITATEGIPQVLRSLEWAPFE